MDVKELREIIKDCTGEEEIMFWAVGQYGVDKASVKDNVLLLEEC